MNSTSTNSRAVGCAPSHLSVTLALITQPFGEGGDSDFEIVMYALSHYKAHLLDQAKRQAEEFLVNSDTSGQLGKIEQIAELQFEMQQRLIMADQYRVKPKSEEPLVMDTTAPAIDHVSQPAPARTRLQSQYNKLHESIDTFLQEEDMQGHLNRLSHLWNNWSVYGIGDGEGNPNAIYQVSSKALDDTFALMRLMWFLTSIGETWSSIQRLTERANAE